MTKKIVLLIINIILDLDVFNKLYNDHIIRS